MLDQLKKIIPYKWKVQTAKSWGCECVAYIDARDVMDLLDEVVGPENWSDEFFELGGKMFCRLSIKVGDNWISKQDVGTPSNMDADKGEASDAFKRAAVKWGVGRFLYDLGTVRVKSIEANGKFFPADDYGKRVYDLTKHINQTGKGQPDVQPQSPAPSPAPAKTGYKKKEAPAPEAEPLATQEQRDKIRELAEAQGMTGTKFTDKLKASNLTWKGLTVQQAYELLAALGA